MVSRAESAAATRVALLRAASQLLDGGGPDAVTLRAVGARAGVSRGAPYGHFQDKEHLLTQLAIDAWNEFAEELHRLQRDPQLNPAATLTSALLTLLEIGRERPHLYELMWAAPSGEPSAALLAASGSQDQFLQIVAQVVGQHDVRRYGALLMSSAHGIAGMELSGHLSQDKWNVTGNELISMLVTSIRTRSR
ncbi:TetR/AcrR family transcriptional regulator [Cryobacterium sp. GrIS_2_6]|uniref:TetR/AcrR family transcriptional regulator n=1 Tax=Cryobacterium sp. GrIS_2_6 TaxID=3162785 RepID=UPI002DFF951D|nr:AcrR family transcriptional regulator [Cryobacterium psychrotolerans]